MKTIEKFYIIKDITARQCKKAEDCLGKIRESIGKSSKYNEIAKTAKLHVSSMVAKEKMYFDNFYRDLIKLETKYGFEGNDSSEFLGELNELIKQHQVSRVIMDQEINDILSVLSKGKDSADFDYDSLDQETYDRLHLANSMASKNNLGVAYQMRGQ